MIEELQDIFLDNPLGQIFGVIAYIISIYTFAFCKNKKFLFFMAILSGFWAIHFFLISAMSAFIVNLIDIFKNIFAIKYEKSKKLLLLFGILYLIFGVYYYTDIISILPIFCALFGLYLSFYVRGIYLNIGYLIILIFWLAYNLYNNSIGGVVSDISLFISGIYGIYNITKSNKGKNTEF